MKRVLILLSLLGGFAGGIYFLWSIIPARHAPGVQIAPKPPREEPISKPIAPFEFKGFQIEPLREFFVTARVLSRREYYDDTAALSPVDLALGWGVMSDQAILDKLSISQSTRYYFYEYQFPAPAPPEELKNGSTNMHLIPSTPDIRQAIGRVRKGEVVRFSGYLVNVSRSDGLSWRTSLTREDSGKGACEIVYVSTFEIVPPLQQ